MLGHIPRHLLEGLTAIGILTGLLSGGSDVVRTLASLDEGHRVAIVAAVALLFDAVTGIGRSIESPRPDGGSRTATTRRRELTFKIDVRRGIVLLRSVSGGDVGHR